MKTFVGYKLLSFRTARRKTLSKIVSLDLKHITGKLSGQPVFRIQSLKSQVSIFTRLISFAHSTPGRVLSQNQYHRDPSFKGTTQEARECVEHSSVIPSARAQSHCSIHPPLFHSCAERARSKVMRKGARARAHLFHEEESHMAHDGTVGRNTAEKPLLPRAVGSDQSARSNGY